MIRCIFIFIVFAVSLFSCHRSAQGDENMTDSTEDYPSLNFEGIPSYYDTVAAPVLRVNDVHLYDSFEYMMRFSDQMPTDGSIRGLSATFYVDSSGVMRDAEVHATELKEEFDRVYKYLIKQMTWTPAYLKRDPKQKERFLVWLNIRVDKDSVLLDIRGGSQFLYKRYDRPMVHN